MLSINGLSKQPDDDGSNGENSFLESKNSETLCCWATDY